MDVPTHMHCVVTHTNSHIFTCNFSEISLIDTKFMQTAANVENNGGKICVGGNLSCEVI